jgi:hypothetical protein
VCIIVITITIVVKEGGKKNMKKKEGGTAIMFLKPTCSGFDHQDVPLFGIVVISS